MTGRDLAELTQTSRQAKANIERLSARAPAFAIEQSALAGLLVAAIGEGWCFLVNGLSYLAVIAALAAMRLPPAGQPCGDGARPCTPVRYSDHGSRREA